MVGIFNIGNFYIGAFLGCLFFNWRESKIKIRKCLSVFIVILELLSSIFVVWSCYYHGQEDYIDIISRIIIGALGFFHALTSMHFETMCPPLW